MAESGARRGPAGWVAWLGLGVLAGVLLGFAVGLARPRAQTPRIQTPPTQTPPIQTPRIETP